MKFGNPLFCFILGLVFLSCNSTKKHFELSLNHKDKEYHLGDNLTASIENTKGYIIDSVVYFYGNQRIGQVTSNTPFSIQLNNQALGRHSLRAKVYSEGESYQTDTELKLLYDKKPVLYTYKIVNTYPHDIEAYTQGLDFYKGHLYESTGQHGESSLRKVDLETGKVLQKINLNRNYFGEGITVLNDKIYMLTWRTGVGFVYDLNFKKLKTFHFDQSEEGWGLTTNGKVLFKSDGTEKIWILDPETLEEKYAIQTVTKHGIITKLNELEWVEGKIYANTYLKDGVVIINPKTGAIEGLIDLRGLRDKVTQHPKLDVLNGIAYNPKTKKLYVTGKNWDKLFEIKIIKE